jgi:hypothetical protein
MMHILQTVQCVRIEYIIYGVQSKTELEMSLWTDVRKIRAHGKNSQTICLGRANEFIDNLEGGNYAKVIVEDDRVVIEVLEFSELEEADQ